MHNIKARECKMSYGIQRPDFPDGCAIVFGGSGGLGSAIAGLLTERGSNVVLTFRTQARVADQLTKNAAPGRTAKAIQCDVTNRQAVDTVIQTALDSFGRIHSVITSQGRPFSAGPVAT